jgi:hypothetical protein
MPGNFKLLIIIFFIYPQIFPQIPINGFCKYNRYNTDSGYTKLLTLNFNHDSYTDLIFFNSQERKIVSLKGDSTEAFSAKRNFYFPVEISSLQPLYGRSGISGYAFSSRKNKRAGIYEFRKNGRPVLTKSISFDSYPENINTAEINGKNEILISGSAFDGLSLLSPKEKQLEEKKIISKTAFSHAVFAELNNDEFPDISAFEVITQSFVFFYNNGEGKFRKARTIPFQSKINSLYSFDLNLDSYEDLIFTRDNFITIMYGDFRSAYENTQNIQTNYQPDKIITRDFNKDGLIDIAYLNLKESIICLLFAKDEYNFYPEIIYLHKNGLKTIAPFYSKFIDGIIALSEDGNIYTITKLRPIFDELSITIGGHPSAISFFDSGNNSITDICFIDNFDKAFKFIIRDNRGIPGTFYSVPLSEAHTQILVDNSDPQIKNYFCYSINKRLIEIIKADFNDNQIKKTTLYSPGQIKDLKIKTENAGKFKIYIAFIKDSELSLGVYSVIDTTYSFSAYPVTSPNVYESSISMDNNIGLYFWQGEDLLSLTAANKVEETGKYVLLAHKQFRNAREKSRIKIKFPLNNISSIVTFTGDLLSLDNDVNLSFISAQPTNYVVVATDTSITTIKDQELSDDFRITDYNQLFFGETRFNGLKRLCLYLPDKKEVKKLQFVRNGKSAVITKITDSVYISSYFIKNMSTKDYHLVYTDPYENCITIKRING